MKRFQTSWASLLLLTLTVLLMGGLPAQAQDPEVFYCSIKKPRCRTEADTFALQDLRDLYVFVTWPGLRGKHVQVVEFILPNGHLYERKETAFKLRRKKRQKGQPFVTESRGVPTVITVLPVAGTFITQHGLSGTWTIRVFLDGELVQLSQFTLTPDAAP